MCGRHTLKFSLQILNWDQLDKIFPVCERPVTFYYGGRQNKGACGESKNWTRLKYINWWVLWQLKLCLRQPGSPHPQEMEDERRSGHRDVVAHQDFGRCPDAHRASWCCRLCFPPFLPLLLDLVAAQGCRSIFLLSKFFFWKRRESSKKKVWRADGWAEHLPGISLGHHLSSSPFSKYKHLPRRNRSNSRGWQWQHWSLLILHLKICNEGHVSPSRRSLSGCNHFLTYLGVSPIYYNEADFWGDRLETVSELNSSLCKVFVHNYWQLVVWGWKHVHENICSPLEIFHL